MKGGQGLRLLICRLKKEYEAGETFEYGDVENVEAEIWFCDRETVQVTVNVLEKVLKDWKEYAEEENA